MALFIGRNVELGRITDLVGAAREGVSGVLVVAGEPGIGKTALLDQALTSCSDALVLRCCGAETEAEIPYVGLGDLFGSVADQLGSLPPRQAEALSGVLALGPSVAGDRFAVSIATLGLLSVLAENGPVVVAVDDAHWVDRFSLEALAFTARRLGAEGIAMVFTIRDAEIEGSGIAQFGTLRLGGLDGAAARELVATNERASVLPGTLVDRLIAQACGNPLALLELPALADRQRYAESDSAPLPVGDQLIRAFRSDVAGLPADTREALLLTAVLDPAPVSLIERALESCGLPIEALDTAEEAGLIAESGGRLAFRHPLVRAVVYHTAPATRRRRAHRMSARLLAGSDAPDALERRAWNQILAAETETDESLANQLDESAARRLDRHSYAAAAHSLAQAAQLTPHGPTRSLRLLRAADATRLAGRLDEASTMLGRVAATTTDVRIRAHSDFARLRMQAWRGQARTGRDALVRLAEQTGPLAADEQVVALTTAAIASIEIGDLTAADTLSLRACQMVRPDRPGSEAAYVTRSLALNLRGDSLAGRAMLARHEPCWQTWDPFARDLSDQLILVAGLSHLTLDDPAARTLMTTAVDTARRSDALGVLPFRTGQLAWIEFLNGRWHRALALGHETLELARETGWTNLVPLALANLCRIEGGLGRAQDCRDHAAAARDTAAEAGTPPYLAYADYGLGLLALGAQQLDRASELLEGVARAAAEFGLADTPLLPWASLLAEIRARRGERDGAHELLEAMTGDRAGSLPPTAGAVAARCRALLEPLRFEEHLRDALALHEQSAVPFEQARTELCFGVLLRRHHRPAEAREWLSSAHLAFGEHGATTWAQQAAAELRTLGVRSRSQPPAGSVSLTPQELQVALAVGDGLTNREVAAKLYLSVKTVEFHLSNVYRKLGVSRRAALAGRLARMDVGGPVAAGNEPVERRPRVHEPVRRIAL